MISQEHKAHITNRIAHSDCCECNADTERRFVFSSPFKYQHVHEYLSWARPRIDAIKAGENSDAARIWHKDFMKALHNRISSHTQASGRKQCHSYLERFRQFRGMSMDAGYLRAFSQRGASALDR